MKCLRCDKSGKHFESKICPQCRANGATKAENQPKLYKRTFGHPLQCQVFGQVLYNLGIRDIRPTRAIKVFVNKQPAAQFQFVYYVTPDEEESHALVEADFKEAWEKVVKEAKAKAAEEITTDGFSQVADPTLMKGKE